MVLLFKYSINLFQVLVSLGKTGCTCIIIDLSIASSSSIFYMGMKSLADIIIVDYHFLFMSLLIYDAKFLVMNFLLVRKTCPFSRDYLHYFLKGSTWIFDTNFSAIFFNKIQVRCHISLRLVHQLL